MAHAGTPTDLAKQPATSGSIWKLLLNAIVILAIGLALAMAASFLIRASSVPAVDRGYDAIEKARGAWALSGVTNSNAVEKAAADKARAMSGVPVDTSYDAIENLRALSGVTVDTSSDAVQKAAAAKARAMSGVPVDTSYDAIENLRALSGVTVDTSYDAVEKARGAAPLSGTQIDPTTFDRTPRGAHGMLP